MQMVERCPSGKLGYEIDGVPVEPDLPRGDLGDEGRTALGDRRHSGDDVQRETLEVRNRVTLCRCGQSKNKPLCDGTHAAAGFREG